MKEYLKPELTVIDFKSEAIANNEDDKTPIVSGDDDAGI